MAHNINVVLGDSINLEADLDQNITNWKIRCEIYDNCGHCIKLASLNSGGSDSQIEIFDSVNGIFIIHVLKNLTTNFEKKSFIEIEAETDGTEIFTIHQGNIIFSEEKITWETPT